MGCILAVDDSPTMRQLINWTLTTAGYGVVLAQDGDEALQLAQREAVNLVISDIYMARVDGISLTRELRRLDTYRDVPVFLMTTESNDEKKREAKAAGVSGWITKPFSPEKLLSVVAQALG